MNTSRIVAPDTRSTANVYATLRRALLEYVDPITGHALPDLLKGPHVYVTMVPEDAPSFPYITIRLTLASDTGTNSYRQTGTLSVDVIGKPSRQAVLVEDVADVCDAVLVGYTEPGSGLVLGRGRTRETLPRFTDPADKDIVGVTLSYSLILWPRVSTDRARTLS